MSTKTKDYRRRHLKYPPECENCDAVDHPLKECPYRITDNQGVTETEDQYKFRLLKVKARREKQKAEYIELPRECRHCTAVGHHEDQCKYRLQEEKAQREKQKGEYTQLPRECRYCSAVDHHENKCKYRYLKNDMDRQKQNTDHRKNKYKRASKKIITCPYCKRDHEATKMCAASPLWEVYMQMKMKRKSNAKKNVNTPASNVNDSICIYCDMVHKRDEICDKHPMFPEKLIIKMNSVRLTKAATKLRAKTCYLCQFKGHCQSQCPGLEYLKKKGSESATVPKATTVACKTVSDYTDHPKSDCALCDRKLQQGKHMRPHPIKIGNTQMVCPGTTEASQKQEIAVAEPSSNKAATKKIPEIIGDTKSPKPKPVNVIDVANECSNVKEGSLKPPSEKKGLSHGQILPIEIMHEACVIKEQSPRYRSIINGKRGSVVINDQASFSFVNESILDDSDYTGEMIMFDSVMGKWECKIANVHVDSPFLVKTIKAIAHPSLDTDLILSKNENPKICNLHDKLEWEESHYLPWLREQGQPKVKKK